MPVPKFSRFAVKFPPLFLLIYISTSFLSCDEPDLMPAVEIAQFPKGKEAALSFTFDDGCYSVITTIAPILDEYNYKATFFIVAGYITSDAYWMDWKKLSDRGFEIGNHSLTHLDLRDTKDPIILRHEINDSFDLIKEKIGKAPFSFSHPYHRTSKQTDAIVFERHKATRIRPSGFCNMYSIDSSNPDAFDEIVQDGLQKHQWIVTTAHGVGDCFNPLSEEGFRTVLSIAKKYEDQLAIGTFEELARYKLERSKTRLTFRKSDTELTITLSPDLSGFNVPLTLKINDPEIINGQVTSQDSTVHFIKGSALYVETMPGTTVKIFY
jgi:peptidoglycan/xylan/chitin deacetylase (PgdA/CDA1 family)